MEEPLGLRSIIVQALATELKVSEAAVEAARSLRGELQMDSIAAANVAFAVEEVLGIEVDIKKEDDLDSVDAIVAMVRRSGAVSGPG